MKSNFITVITALAALFLVLTIDFISEPRMGSLWIYGILGLPVISIFFANDLRKRRNSRKYVIAGFSISVLVYVIFLIQIYLTLT